MTRFLSVAQLVLDHANVEVGFGKLLPEQCLLFTFGSFSPLLLRGRLIIANNLVKEAKGLLWIIEVLKAVHAYVEISLDV